jgi:hypothetical protein
MAYGTMVAGPLSGLVGLVEGMRGRERVEILLQMLGRVELAAAAVEQREGPRDDAGAGVDAPPREG